MRFFTPDRYIRFNSDIPSVADAADEEWEAAVREYRQHIGAIRNRLPIGAREFAEKTSLHDALYLGYLKTAVPQSAGELAVVTVDVGEDILLLIYVLADEPLLGPRIPGEVFHDDPVQWLYDEFDLLDDGTCIHEVLLSNGRVLTLPFVAFDRMTVPKRDLADIRTRRVAELAAT